LGEARQHWLPLHGRAPEFGTIRHLRTSVSTSPHAAAHQEVIDADALTLYANIANGGVLDDPAGPRQTPQYDWLVARLRAVKARNSMNRLQKAVLLTLVSVYNAPILPAGRLR
jgi:hypothetical protein